MHNSEKGRDMRLLYNILKKDHKLYEKMNLERFLLEEELDKRAEADRKIQEIDYFVENIYARDIFNKYGQKKPLLICNATDEITTWEAAFGNDFDNLSIGLRHSLVGLFEGGGKYRFK